MVVFSLFDNNAVSYCCFWRNSFKYNFYRLYYLLNEVPKIKLLGGHLDSSLLKDRKMCASSVPPEYILIERLKNVLYRLNIVTFLECWLGGG